MKRVIFILILGIFFLGEKSYSSEKKKSVVINKKLKIEEVVDYLFKNNHNVRSLLLSYQGTSSDLLRFRSKYDLNLVASALHSSQKSSLESENYYGQLTANNYSLVLRKKFSTGTTIEGSLYGLDQERKDPLSTLATSGKKYQSGVKVEVSQEILKNSFGIIDRQNEKQKINEKKMNRLLIREKLAVLLVDAIVGYWNVAIAEKNLVTTKENLESTIDIRNLIIKKRKLGLAEKEDLLDWKRKVRQSQNRHEQAQKILFDARLAVLRVLNLDFKTEFETYSTFKKGAPQIKLDQAYQDAFLKRVDWNNQKIRLENAKINYQVAENSFWPSLKIKAGIGTEDHDFNSYSKTFDDFNREYSVGLEFNYPLENRAGEVFVKDSKLAWQQQVVSLEKLEKSIKNELNSLINRCQVDYKIYRQNKEAKDYAQGYYKQVLAKFKRGRYSAVQLKMALDEYLIAWQTELQSLIDYNVSILKRDLARNVVFDNYNIDIDRILKKIED